MILRITLILVLVLALAGAGVWLLGPREPVDTTVTFDPAAIGDDPEAYLAREEADVPDLRENAAKEIVWAYPASRARTPLAIVYVHGFSAAKGEVRPLADQVADALDANLFYTRLTGHGRDGPAMGTASVNDWINDLAEAIAIGRRIGQKVVVIASSTGATLATLSATVPGLMDDVEGVVLLSPNYGLKDRWAFMLDLPFARDILPLVAGDTYGFVPANAAQEANWTTRYPITALLPMAAVIRAALDANLESISIPALFLTYPGDAVVNPEATRAVAARWGAPNDLVQVASTDDPAGHLLAGDILSPSTTPELAAVIADWIRAVGSG